MNDGRKVGRDRRQRRGWGRPHERGRGWYLGWAVLAVATGAVTASGQEALRSSLTGQMALEAKRRRIAAGWGDLRLGAWRFDLNATLALELNDNIRYEEVNPRSDLVVRPGFAVAALYPVTEKNVLTLNSGISYNAFLTHPDLNYLHVSPDSNLSFDVFVGNLLLNFHNRFHYTQEVADQPDVRGSFNYGRLDNQSGLLAVWDLNKLVVAFNYDHQIYQSTDDRYRFTDRTAELFGLRVGWLVTPLTPVGLEFGVGWTDFNNEDPGLPIRLNDLFHYSAGLFYEMPAGRFIRLRAGAGYVVYDPTTDVMIGGRGGEPVDGVYADLSVQHQLTQHIRYVLSAGQQVRSGWYADALRSWYGNLTVSWNILRGYSLATSAGYERSEEEGGSWFVDPEVYDRYSVGVAIGKRLGPNLAASLGYSHIVRDSNIHWRSYTQNRLVLTGTYTF
ncbi:outer membrane beta-barrel protein [Limisphaera ngatamarikiensis]|uniref:Outer membrane beta-barrel protein n=1 Tax=Limisphaera ngatamarikiensis TaxID=1324935 RepID=A0A6M1RGL5_9BACT|nr:outer membrane beta-barrel protein [Limisphaera ngatamarikiensis]NGO38746.1 outer membrane beta-barrel protein [Limisphaera ngatamarikiensis]